MPFDLVTLNQLPVDDFIRVAGPLFEHSPWIALRAASRRPFASVPDMHAVLVNVVDSATEGEKLALIRAHPDLAGKLAIAGDLTTHSRAEQKSARLDQLTPEQFADITALNERYRKKFEFPFVLCVRDHTQAELFEAFHRRIDHDRSAEMDAALTQIGRIAWHRLLALVASA